MVPTRAAAPSPERSVSPGASALCPEEDRPADVRQVGVGPWPGGPEAWPADPRYDRELLTGGDRRNVVDRYRYWAIAAIRADLAARAHRLHIAIENVSQDLNIGSIVRSANAFNVAGVHIIGRRRWNKRGAMVTNRYLDVRHHPEPGELLDWAAADGYEVIGIDNGPGAQPLEGAALPERCLMVFGSEGEGISAELSAGCSRLLRIGQYGSTRSINVAARRQWPCTPGSSSTQGRPPTDSGCWRPAVSPRLTSGETKPVLNRLRSSPRTMIRFTSVRIRGTIGLAPLTHTEIRRHPVAIATPESYADMLDRAKAGKYAIPAINVTSSQTLSAALKGFADAESDGIVQISNGGAAYWSGSSRLDRVKGSIAFTAYARAVGDLYPVTIGLHTDHCPKKLLADWIHPLMEIEAEQVKNGELPMFNSHMWDGSAEALDDNIEIAVDMLKRAKAANVVLEIEIGAVGGEEDGIKGEENANLYTTADDAWKAVEALGLGENGRYITALTFGNVHGSYKPGHVKLRPEILGEIQDEVAKRLGDRLSSKVGDKNSPFDLVMHGGSGSTDEEIATAVRNGVIKMNVDTDTQYAYTRPVAGWMYTNYEGVLKIDGEVGNKKQYDPRAWGKAAEEGMAARVVEACERLGSVGSARK